MKLPGIIRYLNKKWRLSRDVIRYFDTLPVDKRTAEQDEVVHYLRHRPASIFPYAFCDTYQAKDIDVRFDSEKKLWYVLQDGTRIFVKRKWKKHKIQRKYRALLLEQDPQSPHRYLTPSFDVSEGDVLVDIGSAEGNFAVSVIEKVKRIYLIEADKEWVEALEATFAPGRKRW